MQLLRKQPTPALAAALAAAVAVGVPMGASASTPPDGDGPDALASAQAEFAALAAERGVTLVDPVCVETELTLIFTCYGRNPDDQLLVATIDLSGEEPDTLVLSEPESSAGSTPADEPNLGPISAAEVTFDPLRFFDGLFSADPERLEEQASWVQPGSPAESYLDYQRRYLATATAHGNEVTRSYVYLTPDSVRVCVTADTCSEIDNLVTEYEQLVSFDVGGGPVSDRLAQPTPPITIGSSTAQLDAAYGTVTGEQLAAFLTISGTGNEVFELSSATYVAPDGTQTAVDTSNSFGAVDQAVAAPMTVLLAFPDALPGGEIRVIAVPGDGSTPLAAVIPVEPLDAAG